MGYAFPRMRQHWGPLASAALLGVLWGTWHLPVIDYLGAATPHGAYWFPFFLAFTVAMTAMRVLIAFVYTRTNSVLLAQLMHASSTSALAVFSPAGVSAAQEVVWYLVYGDCVVGGRRSLHEARIWEIEFGEEARQGCAGFLAQDGHEKRAGSNIASPLLLLRVRCGFFSERRGRPLESFVVVVRLDYRRPLPSRAFPRSQAFPH